MTIEIQGSVALVGDIHGFYEPYLYPRVYTDNLIFLGDIGFGFFPLESFISGLMMDIPRDVECYFIRGNHDNPEYWWGKSEEVTKINPHYHMVNDYDVVVIHGNRYLCVGGGISIDRNRRVPGKSYWDTEPVLPPPADNDIKDIYGILSHTGFIPSVITHKNYFIEKYPDIEADTKKEQELLKTIYYKYKPKVWYNGHYHVHQEFDYNDCKIIQLNCNEPWEIH